MSSRLLKKSASSHRLWRVKRETCEKGATWIDWIPTSSRSSSLSRSAILRGRVLSSQTCGALDSRRTSIVLQHPASLRVVHV